MEIQKSVCCSVLTRIDEIQRLMSENGLKEMPIVDNMLEKHLLGVIIDEDIMTKAKLESASPSQLSTEQCMRTIPSVRETSNLDEVRNLFQNVPVETIPVSDREGRFCGTVAKSSLN